MDMPQYIDPRLLISTAGYFIGAGLNLWLAFFVIYKQPKNALARVYFLMSIAVATFQISHAIGINIYDHELSRKVLMFNLSNIFIGLFLTHWMLLVAGQGKKLRRQIIFMYGLALGGLVFFMLHPETFLLASKAKLYLPNYYVPGKYDFAMRLIFTMLLPSYALFYVVKRFIQSTDSIERNRMKYVFVGVAYGLGLGLTAVFLVYDIPFDPFWSVFFGLYTIPFAYAILEYDLMNIQVVAKRALYYTLAVVSMSLAIVFVNFSNDWLQAEFPGMPKFALPILSSLIAVAIGVSVWKRIRETDVLKYEFIAVITHKFRTPLTHIKWAINNLLEELPEKREQLQQIEKSNSNLIELTNVLVDFSTREEMAFAYVTEEFDLSRLVKKAEEYYRERALKKQIEISFEGEGKVAISADKQKIKAVIQVLIENAITYTPKGGKILVSVKSDAKKATCIVKDSGVGIPKDELPKIFNRFYRGADAKTMDTEGLGIGLSIAQNIVHRHGGKITAESDGKDMGSKFTITLPKR